MSVRDSDTGAPSGDHPSSVSLAPFGPTDALVETIRETFDWIRAPAIKVQAEEALASLAAVVDTCCDLYWCPTAGEIECPRHGGFDTCCDNPDAHVPVASVVDRQQEALKRIADGTWNRGTSRYLTAREFARAASRSVPAVPQLGGPVTHGPRTDSP